MMKALFVIAFALAAVASARTAGVKGTIGNIHVYFDVVYSDDYCAWAEFNDTLGDIGWGSLSVVGISDDSNLAHYCSGYAEAALTHTRISQYYSVTYDALLEEFGGSFPQKISDWLTRSLDWTRDMAADHRDSDIYWKAISDTLARFDGLKQGYRTWRSDPDRTLNDIDFLIMESAGDLDDLTFLVDNPELRKKFSSDAWRDTHHHCTGLIYMEPDFQDVYVAHDSWSAYNTMNRMLKDYSINPTNSKYPATRWTFSSNAGLLLSMDDFWIMNSGLVVIETTLHTWNTTLYDVHCVPETVLSWIRVSAVNMIAHDGQEWAKYFEISNSWTYNNQYMIVDTNKFVRGKKLLDGFLVTTEQVPGYYVVGDRTDELVQNRWIPSINTPFYAKVYNASGYPEKVIETQCDYWSYDRCARNLIMKRDVIKKIHSYSDFRKFMRYNDWSNDALSNNDPAESILSRYDLRPDECLHMGTMTMCPNAFGGLDAKTTNMDLAKSLRFDAISSPQYETQPAWVFGVERWRKVRYDGLPTLWKFPWIQFGPVAH